MLNYRQRTCTIVSIFTIRYVRLKPVKLRTAIRETSELRKSHFCLALDAKRVTEWEGNKNIEVESAYSYSYACNFTTRKPFPFNFFFFLHVPENLINRIFEINQMMRNLVSFLFLIFEKPGLMYKKR